MEQEEKLIRRIVRRGDRKAAGLLVERYYEEIFFLVARQTGESRETVMDVTQEIFVSMLRSLPGYDREKAAFRTWLSRIATYKIVDRYRSRAYHEEKNSVPIEEETILETKELHEALEDRETAGEILRYMETLPSETQLILRLRIFGEQAFDDIAQQLDLPVSTVKTRYYRAIEKIRKEMTE